jgi:hypothetical protein
MSVRRLGVRARGTGTSICAACRRPQLSFLQPSPAYLTSLRGCGLSLLTHRKQQTLAVSTLQGINPHQTTFSPPRQMRAAGGAYVRHLSTQTPNKRRPQGQGIRQGWCGSTHSVQGAQPESRSRPLHHSRKLTAAKTGFVWALRFFLRGWLLGRSETSIPTDFSFLPSAVVRWGGEGLEFFARSAPSRRCP